MKTGAILDSCVLLVIKLSHWKLFLYFLYEGKPPTFAKWCHHLRVEYCLFVNTHPSSRIADGKE